MLPMPPQSDASSFMLGPGPPIVTGDSERGPPGCNLFVFHLPNELTNWDLYLLFRRFGTIISVHTMINKNTGLSRGFGFVSFSKEEEAIAAVRSMDGFRLGKKRLKVQRKREHEGDEEGFGQDFDNFYGYAGFPTEYSPPSAALGATSPRYGGSSTIGLSLSPSQPPLSQPSIVTPQRNRTPMLSTPSPGLSGRVVGGNGMGVVIGGSPLGLGQGRGTGDHHLTGQMQGQGLLSSAHDMNQDTSHMRVSFEKEYHLNEGGQKINEGEYLSRKEDLLDPFARMSTLRGQGQPNLGTGSSMLPSLGMRQQGHTPYESRERLPMVCQDEGQYDQRGGGGVPLGSIGGREGGGFGGQMGLGGHEQGKPLGIGLQGKELIRSPPQPHYQEERERDIRRLGSDPFALSHSLGLMGDASPGGSPFPLGLTLSQQPKKQYFQSSSQQPQSLQHHQMPSSQSYPQSTSHFSQSPGHFSQSPGGHHSQKGEQRSELIPDEFEEYLSQQGKLGETEAEGEVEGGNQRKESYERERIKRSRFISRESSVEREKGLASSLDSVNEDDEEESDRENKEFLEVDGHNGHGLGGLDGE